MGYHGAAENDVLGTIAEQVGADTAVAMSHAFGGQEIPIPTRDAGRTWKRLAGAVGEDAARRLIDLFRGEKIYIPLNALADRRVLADAIRDMRAEGLTHAEIAGRICICRRVSVRWVRRILAAAKDHERKAD